MPEPLCTGLQHGIQLRLDFVERGDRLGHRIALVSTTGESTLLLESLEGNSADNWPPSPPLQSVSIEERGLGERVALLLGMAGNSHWSASIVVPANQPKLIFDVACRHRAMPTWMGSQYEPGHGLDHRIEITGDFAMSLEGPQGAVIGIRPTALPQATGTTRWGYAIGYSPFAKPLFPED
jgi:hypothetical protein